MLEFAMVTLIIAATLSIPHSVLWLRNAKKRT